MVGTVVLTEVAVLGHFSLKLWLAWQISVHCQATVIYDRTRRDIHSKDKERKRETGKDGDFILDTNMLPLRMMCRESGHVVLLAR